MSITELRGWDCLMMNLLLKGKDLIHVDGCQLAKRRGRETRRGSLLLLLRFHLHFWVGGQCDESRHHSLSYQRLINPLHQQLIGLERASRDVTEVGGAVGQECATPPIDFEERGGKTDTKQKGGEKEKHKKIGRKWYTMTRTIAARHGTALHVSSQRVYTHTHTHTRTNTHAHTRMQKKWQTLI